MALIAEILHAHHVDFQAVHADPKKWRRPAPLRIPRPGEEFEQVAEKRIETDVAVIARFFGGVNPRRHPKRPRRKRGTDE